MQHSSRCGALREMVISSLEAKSMGSKSAAPRAQDIQRRPRAHRRHGLRIPYNGEEPVQFRSDFICILRQCLEVPQLVSTDVRLLENESNGLTCPPNKYALTRPFCDSICGVFADIQILRATLELSRQRGSVPLDWEQKLEAFRQTPQYHAMIEVSEPMIVQFVQGASEPALIDLLKKVMKGMPLK